MQARLIGCFAAAMIALSALAANAQMRGGFSSHASFGGPSAGGGFHRSPRYGQAAFFGDPYYYDDYSTGRFVADAPPQVFILQRPAPPDPPKAPIHPLLIELQGDRYVRVGDTQNENNQIAALQPPNKFTDRSKDSPAPKRALTPTVLIYRNGLRENIPQYAIIGKIIYARGNYWQDGYWTKNIQISALNLPATIQANQDNGVNFTLPAGPSEVVTRP